MEFETDLTRCPQGHELVFVESATNYWHIEQTSETDITLHHISNTFTNGAGYLYCPECHIVAEITFEVT